MKLWQKVEITWLDAQTEDDWTEIEDYKSPLAKVTSVGYFLDKTDSAFSIASSRSEDTVFSILTVPRQNIILVREL